MDKELKELFKNAQDKIDKNVDDNNTEVDDDKDTLEQDNEGDGKDLDETTEEQEIDETIGDIEEQFGGKIKIVGGEYVFKPTEIEKDGKKFKTSTVYKGKTLAELLSSIERGILEKDYTISKLKTPQSQTSDYKKSYTDYQEEKETEKISKPDIEKIRSEVASEIAEKIDFDPKYFSYTKEDWRQHELEYGAVETIEIKQAVKEAIKYVKEETEKRYKESYSQYQNKLLVNAETESVVELMNELNINITPEQYEEILEEVLEDEKSFTKDGLLKPGVIQLKVIKKMKPTLSKKEKSTLEDKLMSKINKTSNTVTSISDGGSAKFNTNKAAKTVEEAKERILREMKKYGVK